MSQNQKNISLECQDGRRIAGVLFEPSARPKAAVMIAPATGIRKEFYSHFAEHLSACGYAVLTFDYRGIGESLDGVVSKDDASLQDWGAFDMPAALDYLKSEYAGTTYHAIGHSAGGALAGLMPNHASLSSIFNFGASSGCIKNMDFPFSIKARFFLKAFAPASNFLLGYTKSGLMGMGESLPKKVAQQWGKWCSEYGYAKNDFNKSISTHFYDDVKTPSLWVHATDDPIANKANVQDIIDVFSKADAEILTMDPRDYGLESIGHMNFFRSFNEPLWCIAENWLERHTKPKPADGSPRP